MIHAKEAFIDANLLVLLVVGSVGREQIGKHRRTRIFAPRDFDRLLSLVESLDRVYVTPNTLTEASNLLEDRHDTRFLEKFRILVESSKEIVVASAVATANSAFTRFGLTDTVLLEVVSAKRPLITVDLNLFNAAFAKGEQAAFNFTRRPL